MVDLFNDLTPPQGNFAVKDPQGPPIYVTNATMLGYNQEVQYFGSDIGFNKTIALDISCTATDISNQSGASTESKTLSEFLDDSQDYSTLFINGVLMGDAKVTNFSLDAGDMVNEATCTISFLIHSTYDDLSLLASSTYYKDYADAITGAADSPADRALFPQILDSFSDSISLSRSNNSISYSRSISISANKSLNIQTLGDSIRKFVKGVFAFGTFSFPDLTSFDKDINDLADPTNGFKKFITETTDDTTNTYTFQESLSAGNVKGSYSFVATQQYARDAAGIVTVTESGAIIGLTYPRINAAEAAWETEIALSSDRLKAFYETVLDLEVCAHVLGGAEVPQPSLNEIAGGALLYPNTSKTIDTFEGTINYSVTANNDPKYKDGEGERWEYTITLEGDGTYQTATEQGTINGRGNIKYDGDPPGDILGLQPWHDFYPKYLTARNFLTAEVFKNDNADINSRITSMIDATIFPVSPKLTRRTEAHAPRQGTVSYSRSFSNNPTYRLNGRSSADGKTTLIKKIESNGSLNGTIPIVHDFISPGREAIIVQEQSTKSLSTIAINSTAVGYRIYVGNENARLLSIGNAVNENTLEKGKPINLNTAFDGHGGDAGIAEDAADTIYMNSASFSFSSLNDVIFSLNTSYNGGVGSC